MIRGFDPIATPDARVLILGTVPGPCSLEVGEYYARPQNAFWYIIERLFASRVGLGYAARTSLLMDAKVALWDVLRAAERPGSLDSAIVANSEVPNDFVDFFARNSAVRTVFFNGAKAQSLFDRHVRDALPAGLDMRFVRLPSTSPANARYTREGKLEAWRALCDALAVG